MSALKSPGTSTTLGGASLLADSNAFAASSRPSEQCASFSVKFSVPSKLDQPSQPTDARERADALASRSVMSLLLYAKLAAPTTDLTAANADEDITGYCPVSRPLPVTSQRLAFRSLATHSGRSRMVWPKGTSPRARRAQERRREADHTQSNYVRSITFSDTITIPAAHSRSAARKSESGHSERRHDERKMLHYRRYQADSSPCSPEACPTRACSLMTFLRGRRFSKEY
jgi:hypothetical protein